MNKEWAKRSESLTHNEDSLICSVCKNILHFYCADISESNFKKLSKLNKSKFVCVDCKTSELIITKNPPVVLTIRIRTPEDLEKM
jgi:hypothetical protein